VFELCTTSIVEGEAGVNIAKSSVDLRSSGDRIEIVLEIPWNHQYNRITYPTELSSKCILGAKDLAVDVGAGTGQASVPFTKFFTKVIAVDPSLSPSEEHKQISTFFILYLSNIYKPT
jgi:hypothetical protein